MISVLVNKANDEGVLYDAGSCRPIGPVVKDEGDINQYLSDFASWAGDLFLQSATYTEVEDAISEFRAISMQMLCPQCDERRYVVKPVRSNGETFCSKQCAAANERYAAESARERLILRDWMCAQGNASGAASL